jgi:hypothetical protein
MSRSESLKPENEQFTRHGKRDFTNVVEVKDLEKGRLFPGLVREATCAVFQVSSQIHAWEPSFLSAAVLRGGAWWAGLGSWGRSLSKGRVPFSPEWVLTGFDAVKAVVIK